MWRKLLAILPLLWAGGFTTAYGPLPEIDKNRDSRWNTTHEPVIPEGGSLPIGPQNIYPERDASNTSTHRPVILEGGGFPLPLSLASINVEEDGSVVIPTHVQEYLKALPVNKITNPEEPVPAMCGTYYLSAGEGMVVTTPYYTKNYVNNFKCRWIFVSRDSDELSFHCEVFKLDKKGKDYLGVRHNERAKEKKYRKNNKPSIASTVGGVLRLRFSSNSKDSSKGFKCTVAHLGVPTTTTTTTTTSTTTTSTTTTTTPSLQLSHPLCGLSNTRIVNGAETAINAYPWMVWTYMQWSKPKRWCGGTIIHELWVLTANCPLQAQGGQKNSILGQETGSGITPFYFTTELRKQAHNILSCFTRCEPGKQAHCNVLPILNDAQNNLYYPSSISVIVGAHQKDVPSASGGYIVEVDTRLIFLHPKYQMPYDIALYKLKTPLTFSHRVAPICLAPRGWKTNTFQGVPVFLAGWGKTETGTLADKLRFYNTVGYNFTLCRALYGSWMGDTQMCTDGSARKHSCSGDSGGPVMYREGSRVYQVGVISFGSSSECNDQFPDGQVKVAAFIDWFESITGIIFNI
ncbi:phenoloxidase-activating enzyme-like [Macrobrachium rosenbergii]|uniref:phenoloxidase-activating enzyme-like n=1 Tax=Macrobrachium rosenbergii TaxID=79674 RepID=UPI0034D7B7AF